MGASAEPAVLDGYGPIDGETACRLAARAPSFIRLLTHPVSGTVLDVDRNSYRPPADLQRWLQVRDGTCRFPGCRRAAKHCDIDHGLDWADDGRTECDNLAHVCPAHHHLKHETSWSVRHLADGALEWTSPAGLVHRTLPTTAITNDLDTRITHHDDPAADDDADGTPAPAPPPPASPPLPSSPSPSPSLEYAEPWNDQAATRRAESGLPEAPPF